MKVETVAADQHPDDGALVRVLDEESSAAERAQVAAHIGGCDVCQQRQARFAAWARSASELLGRADAPLRVLGLRADRRPPWAGRWWQAAAAAVLLMLGTVALAAPVRNWLVERWIVVRHLLLAPPTTRSGQTPMPGPEMPVGEVSFTPNANVLVVRIATRQAAGSLVLETSAAPTASATVRGQGEHEAVVVLPDELRIANTTASRATYRITLPARLTGVVVVINGDRAVWFTPVAPGESRTIDLRTKGRR